MYAIIRKKSHRKDELRKIQNHNLRKSKHDNVNHDKTYLNKILLGTNNCMNDVLNYIKSNNLKVRNKTTIVTNEFVLTASPEFFFNNEDGTKKTKDEYQKNLDNWVKNQLKFINNNKYGIAVNAVLHLDESTPHIHFLSIPIYENKLNNKQIWKSKNSYSFLINDYVKVVQKDFPKLQRGTPNSERLEKVKFTELKEYRKDIATKKTELNNLKNLIEQAKKRGFRVGMNEFKSKNFMGKIAITFASIHTQKDKIIVGLENKNKALELDKSKLIKRKNQYKLKLNEEKNKHNSTQSQKFRLEQQQKIDEEKIKNLMKNNEELTQKNNALIIKNNLLNEENFKLKKYEKFINFCKKYFKNQLKELENLYKKHTSKNKIKY